VGTADTVVPPTQGYVVFRAARGPKELLAVRGAEHGLAHDRDPIAYEQAVVGFLRRGLGHAGGADGGLLDHGTVKRGARRG